MSTQTQLNNYYQEYILYYCNSVNSDTTFYDYINLTNVCTVGYDSNTPPQLVISGWLIGSYSAPTNATLLTYVFSTVDAYFNNFYIVPSAIQLTQPYQITTANLNNVINHSFMIGYVCLDTTAQALKFFTGSNWITSASRFLPSGAQTADLNMNSHNVNNVTNIYISNPSCSSCWSNNGVSVSYSANTAQLISMSGFSQTANGNSDFSVTTSSGKCQYTGATSRYFRISISYTYQQQAPLLSTQTLTHFISKNSSTTIGSNQLSVTFATGQNATYVNNSINDIILLNTNDTIQLGGNYTASATVPYSQINYSISQI